MATIRGTAINFGFTGTNGITITGVTGTLQSAELSQEGDIEEVRDADGDLIAEAHYNPGARAVLEIVITGTNLATAITNSEIATNKAKGAYLPITACLSLPELVSNDWRIHESRVSGGNTNAKRLNVTLVKHAGVTGTAS